MYYELLVVDNDGRVELRQDYKLLSSAALDADWYVKEGYHVEITSKKD